MLRFTYGANECLTITITITDYVIQAEEIVTRLSSQRIVMSTEFDHMEISIYFPYKIIAKTLVSVRSIPDNSVVHF